MHILGIGTSSPAARTPAAPAPAPVPAPAPAPDARALREAVTAIVKALGPVANALEFTVDEGNGRTIVRVVDAETQQLVRQIPSEEMVEIARALERLEGLLLRHRA